MRCAFCIHFKQIHNENCHQVRQQVVLSWPTLRKYRYSELLSDPADALMYHYMIALPFTHVNICFTLWDTNTFANLPPPSNTRGEKRLMILWNCPDVAWSSPQWSSEGHQAQGVQLCDHSLTSETDCRTASKSLPSEKSWMLVIHHFRKENFWGSSFDKMMSVSPAAICFEVFWCVILTPISIARRIISANFRVLWEPHWAAPPQPSSATGNAWWENPDAKLCGTAPYQGDDHWKPLIFSPFKNGIIGSGKTIQTSTNREDWMSCGTPNTWNILDRIKDEGEWSAWAWKDFWDTVISCKKKRSKFQNQNL